MTEKIKVTRTSDGFSVSIKQGKQERWFVLSEVEAKQLRDKLDGEIYKINDAINEADESELWA